ncbi:hypothetical protein CU098_004599, partial [Rhizopus stolonifer]
MRIPVILGSIAFAVGTEAAPNYKRAAKEDGNEEAKTTTEKKTMTHKTQAKTVQKAEVTSTPHSTLSLVTSSSSVSSAITSPSTSNSAAMADKASNQDGGISGGAIGGIIAAILIIVVGACSFIALRRRQERRQRHMNRMSAKPDPFTMGFGSDSAFNGGYQPPMQQVNQYQHQYGTQPAAYDNQPPMTENNPMVQPAAYSS